MLPDYYTPHQVLVADLVVGAGMGGTWSDAREMPAFVVDERRLVVNVDGEEVVSNSQVSVGVDEVIPLGSMVTVWPGATAERSGKVIAITQFRHPRMPSFQTLYLE